MQTFQIISLIANLVLGVTILVLFYPRLRKHIEDKRSKRQQLSNARFVKQIRTEVRRYLQELQD